MKKTWKQLQIEDKEYLEAIYKIEASHEEKMNILKENFGVASRTIREWWKRLGLTKNDPNLSKQLQNALLKSIPEDTDIVIMTTAQSKTGVNQDFFKKILIYKTYLEETFNKKVELVIAPLRYRNPTSIVESTQQVNAEWWDKKIEDSLYYSKLRFGDTILYANSTINPTRKRPLTGLAPFSERTHLVVGHPNIAYESLPRFTKDDPIGLMMTTGAITYKNYSKSNAGALGELNHSYGFVIVEKNKNDTCYPPRVVSADVNGNFSDLIFNVNADGVNIVDKVKGLVLGDIHTENLDTSLMEQTRRLISGITIDHVVLHDVYDGYRINPHERQNPYIKKLKIKKGQFDVKEEIDNSLDFIAELASSNNIKNIQVVQSNHDEFLDRHINDMNWKNDLHNSEHYLEYALIQQTVDLTEHGNIFGYLINERFKGDKVHYIPYGGSLKICDIEVGQHGDAGLNGSKGSIVQFARYNTKSVTAHNHRAFIILGAYSVGMSCKFEQYYRRKGGDGATQTHCVIYETGKRQLWTFDKEHELSGILFEYLKNK